jgi:FixJ family two-component response regulator
VVVLDVGLPGMSGIELHHALAKRRDCSVVFLTGRGDVQMSVRAMKDGAVDFLDKPVKRELLLDAVARAVERDVASRERRERASELRARYGLLTERERQVFRLVAEGRLNKQIADVVGLSLRTVKSHRARVMEKMQASNAADLARADELSCPRHALGRPACASVQAGLPCSISRDVAARMIAARPRCACRAPAAPEGSHRCTRSPGIRS